MRVVIILIGMCVAPVVWSASSTWTGLTYFSQEADWPAYGQTDIKGSIDSTDGAHGVINSFLAGHVEGGEYYLKHADYSDEMILSPTLNYWALVSVNTILDEVAFNNLTQIEDCWDNSYEEGGTLIPDKHDFYLAFRVQDPKLRDRGPSWYGWIHASVDDALYMTIMDYGISLNGEQIHVGNLIPEPSCAWLAFLGGALLVLRRKNVCPR